jgi:cytochrome c-type biogenesis protein CcmH/NrfG
MKKVEQVEIEYVKKTTTMLIALICLVAGFVLGILYTSIDSSKEKKIPFTNIQAPPPTSEDNNAAVTHLQNMNLIMQLKQAVSTDPNNSDTWAQLGHAYFDTDQYEKAIEAYKKYLEIKPDNADIWTDLGVMYRRMGNPQEAIRSFDKAMQVNPAHQQSRFNKGVVLLNDLKDRPCAVSAWKELLKINPTATTPNGRPISELINELTSGNIK